MGVLGAGVRLAGRSASGGPGLAKFVNGQTIQGLLIAVISAILFWLVSIYANGLRDPNYFNGWLLAAGMSLQIYFHVALKRGTLAPKAAVRWRRVHIFVGYLLAAAFLSHTDFSLPDTAFEWALWLGFMLVTLSGIFGTYLSWSLKAKRRIDDGLTYDRIPARRAELAREAQAVIVAKTDGGAVAIALPSAPDEAWIRDLYANQLRDFFQGEGSFTAHLVGSHRTLKRLTDEIDSLSSFVDKPSQKKLAALKGLVVEKDWLDFAHVYLGLTKGWLLVHVPVTYTLVVLVVLHVVVVYAFSSGPW